MKVCFLPAGSDHVASSRIRVYSVQQALPSFGVQSRIGYWSEADVMVVQKRVTDDILAQVRSFKERSGIVIYDCDDLGKALAYWAAPAHFRRMVEYADIVTTNTDAFRNVFYSQHTARRVEFIPDVVDYYSEGPVRNSLPDENPIRVLWFGNRSNLHLLRKYVEAFHRIPGCRLIICCDETPELELFVHRNIEYVPWSLSSFIDLLRSCHLTFLPHDGAMADRAKSNNRMITSITWGVPAIVSRTPEYARLANLVGQSQCVIDHPDELEAAVAGLRSRSARDDYLDAAQPVVWKHHSPAAVARRMTELLTRCTHCDGRATGPRSMVPVATD